jgi:hypothetical protein
MAGCLSRAQNRAVAQPPPGPDDSFPPTSPSSFSPQTRIESRALLDRLLRIEEIRRSPIPTDDLISVQGNQPCHRSIETILSAAGVPMAFLLGLQRRHEAQPGCGRTRAVRHRGIGRTDGIAMISPEVTDLQSLMVENHHSKGMSGITSKAQVCLEAPCMRVEFCAARTENHCSIPLRCSSSARISVRGVA